MKSAKLEPSQMKMDIDREYRSWLDGDERRQQMYGVDAELLLAHGC